MDLYSHFIIAARRFVTVVLLIATVTVALSCDSDSDDDGNKKVSYNDNSDSKKRPCLSDEEGYLFLLYECAQNTATSNSTINADIKMNVVQSSIALGEISNNSEYPPITVVTLFGNSNQVILKEVAAGTTLTQDDLLDRTKNASIDLSDSKILPGTDYTSTNKNWLMTGSAPRNMGDAKMLEDFLVWANDNYPKCNLYKNVVLCIADHGAGAYMEDDVYQSDRILCKTNYGKGAWITSADIAQALQKSCFSSEYDRRPLIIWEDCCLQSGVEVLYSLRGVADYFLSSENESYSNDYGGVLKCFKKGSTISNIGSAIVSNYVSVQIATGLPPENINEYSGSPYYTQTFASLDSGRLVALKEAVSSFAAALIEDKANSTLYKNYLNPSGADSNDYSSNNGLCFKGTYAALRDIGYFVKSVSNIKGAAESVKSACTVLKGAIGDVVIASRAATVKASNVPLVSLNYSGDNTFGVTIVARFINYPYSKYNKDYLKGVGDFGSDNAWGDLLATYFG